jgi:hypothetical protein
MYKQLCDVCARSPERSLLVTQGQPSGFKFVNGFVWIAAAVAFGVIFGQFRRSLLPQGSNYLHQLVHSMVQAFLGPPLRELLKVHIQTISDADSIACDIV